MSTRRPPSGVSLAAAVATLLAVQAGGVAGARAADSLADVLARAQAARPGIFGKTEIRSTNLDALPLWQGVVTRMVAEKERLRHCADDPQSCAPEAWRKWHDLMRRTQGRPVTRQTLETVNRTFNAWPYLTDQAAYGADDYWAVPSQFLEHSGDCEDYAIVKFYALLALGQANDDMRIVALKDRVRNLGHAVLVVRLGDVSYVLDNLSDAVVSDGHYKHYDPQYSVNETTRWVHIGGVASQ